MIGRAALVLTLSGCASVSDMTIAPLPCEPQFFPVRPIDLNPRAPQDGVCIRAKITERKL